MPIPLAKRNINQPIIPSAKAGRAFDDSSNLSAIGEMHGNTMKYISKVTDNWGDAVMKVKEQEEEVVYKDALLELNNSYDKEMKVLQTKDGFDAESYRKGDFQTNIKNANQKFYDTINGLSIQAVKNNAMMEANKLYTATNARSEIYAYNQSKAANKELDKEMLTFYTRQTASLIPLMNNKESEFYITNSDNEKAIENMAKKGAERDGIRDKNYIKLKQQYDLDQYHTNISKEIAAAYGYDSAINYLNDKRYKITTAARLAGKRQLEEEKLTYLFTLNPNDFVKNGVPDEEKAASIAPDLRPEERLRIINIGRSAKSGSKSGNEDLTPSELNGAISISKRFETNARSIFEKNGIYVPDKYKDAQMLPAQKKERLEGLKKISDNTRLSDLAQAYFDNVYVPSSTQLVMKQNAFGQAEAMPVRGNYIEQRQQLAAYANDPNVKILSNISALSKTDFDDLEGYYRASVSDKEITDGLDRGLIDPVEYNILDAIGTYLAAEYGYTTNQIADVFQYMLEKQRLGDDFVNAEGKIEHKSYLKGINLTQRGLYDELSRQHNNKLTTGELEQDNAQTADAIEEIKYMLASYIKNEGGSATIGLIYEKAGVSSGASKMDLDKFFNKLKDDRKITAAKLVGKVRSIVPAGTPLFLTENRFLYK